MKVGIVICHSLYTFYLYYMVLAGFDRALGSYFFLLKITKKKKKKIRRKE
jgi:hypothetical protein